jgi:sialidase-1
MTGATLSHRLTAGGGRRSKRGNRSTTWIRDYILESMKSDVECTKRQWTMKPQSIFCYDLKTAMLLLVALLSAGASAEPLVKKVLFVQGRGGYNNHRIPALLTTQAGTLLAFCEAREGGDSSDIDLLLRRSQDRGATWSDAQVVWDQARNVCGNPCPVQDRDTGVIWLLLTWNDSTDSGRKLHNGTSKDTRRVYVCYSDDDGRTWSRPVEITATTKKSDWWWYATGPGIGIQLRDGPHKGRLVIPCDYTDKNGYGSHMSRIIGEHSCMIL